jgi:hypothetical protein
VGLPARHGGQNTSSPELLVDVEEKKSGSAAAFFRRGGATVAGGGSATVRWEGRVSSTLHGRRTARGELGRRSPWSCSRRRRRPDSDGRGARTATVGFESGNGAVRTSEARSLGEQRARGRYRGDGGVGEASCRDTRHGARRLTGGARSSVISELKITPKENSSKQISRD